jgi:hypothetical protein
MTATAGHRVDLTGRPFKHWGSVSLARRLLFQVQSPLGDAIVLTRDRWRQIIRFKHPSLEGHEQEVRECVRRPDLIRESTKDPNVHLYYVTATRGFLCVAVAPIEHGGRFVVTAYFTRNIKPGNQLWKK